VEGQQRAASEGFELRVHGGKKELKGVLIQKNIEQISYNNQNVTNKMVNKLILRQ